MSDAGPPAEELGRWSSPDADTPLVVLVPLGSCEQHGPHLPLDTDTRIAVAVATEVAGRRPRADARVVVAPALSYGASGEHEGFAGTLSIGTDVLASVLVELVRSAGAEVRAVVAVNGHGGNADGLRRAVAQLQGEGRRLVVWSPRRPDGGDLHAGHTETSVLLALDRTLVRLERAVAGNLEPIERLAGPLRSGGVRAVSASGVLGDPLGATAQQGRTILRAWCADLEAVLHGLALG
ncbi:MAG: mycofactocin biosynthesis peptidyl-dipeptidase MftE [Acidimicrobiales bacterium]|nr:mycofactocin biosynthesis peptidyl-dipeptidase MftE [Acidimicrobiales bacterium]